MVTRLLSLLVWAAVGVSALAWGLKFWARGTPVPPGASLAQPAAPAGMDLSRVLGVPAPKPVAEAAPVAADSRFRLLGLAAPGAGQSGGLALIAVDGKPARTWRVGSEVEPGLRLLSVSHRRAELGAAGAAPSLTLELPPLAAAQRGRPADALGVAVPQPGLPPVAGLPGQPGAPAGLPVVPMGASPGGMPGTPNAQARAAAAAAAGGQLAVPGAPVAGGEAPMSAPPDGENVNPQQR
ncbi:type II secretion system protein N [Ideonella sp. DXS22W]|uniref:Type II secretion system protein N n=1 Tax=Pseudaquabacterium inlustre TaxID=2984192 RepID=A0ABU9CS64_9BURK